MTFSEALNYLKNRFGDHAVSAHLDTNADSYCTGCEFRVGRSKHYVVGVKVNDMQLALFADGIEYARAKRSKRLAAQIEKEVRQDEEMSKFNRTRR